jgi:hypothetical protein
VAGPAQVAAPAASRRHFCLLPFAFCLLPFYFCLVLMLLRKVVVQTALGLAGTLLCAIAVRSGWLCGLAPHLKETISVCDFAQDFLKIL